LAGETEERDEKRNGRKGVEEKHPFPLEINFCLRPWFYWSADYELMMMNDKLDDDEWLMTSLRCTVDTRVYTPFL